MSSALDDFWTLLHETQSLLKDQPLGDIPPRPQGAGTINPQQIEKFLASFQDRLALGQKFPEILGQGTRGLGVLAPAPLTPEDMAALASWFENEKVGWKKDQDLWITHLAPFASQHPPYKEFYQGLMASHGIKVLLVLGAPAARELLGIPLALDRLRGQSHPFGAFQVVVTHHPQAIAQAASDPAAQKNLKIQVWQDVQRALGLVKFSPGGAHE